MMKKISKLIVFVLAIVMSAFTIMGCDKDVAVLATNVEITNTESALTVGEHDLLATVTPQKASQEVVFSLATPISGVTLTGNKIKVADTAKDGAIINIKVAVKANSAITATKAFTVSNVITTAVTSVVILNSKNKLPLGTTELLSQVMPALASQAVTYSIKTSVDGVSIDGNNIIVSESAINGTKIVVVATSNADTTKKAEKEFVVDKAAVIVPVQSVAISNAVTSLNVGDTTLTATVLPSNASQEVTFSQKTIVAGVTLVGNIVTVSAEALHSALVTFLVTSNADNTKTAEKIFTVNNPDETIQVESVAISNTNSNIVVGKTTLTATVLPSNASQEVIFSVQTEVDGIELVGDELTVASSVAHETTITIIATSTAAPAISGNKIFTVYNPFAILTQTEKVVAVGDTVTIPAVADSDWKVSSGAYVDEKNLIEVSYAELPESANVASFVAEEKSYKITYTLKTSPHATKDYYVIGIIDTNISSITAANCAQATIGDITKPLPTITDDATIKFLNSNTIKMTGTASSQAPQFAVLWNSAIYNDINNVKLFAYNSSEKNVLMTTNAERNSTELVPGKWTGINLDGGTFNWCNVNHGVVGSKTSTGYRVANEWKFRFWFNALQNTNYDVNLAIVIDKGTLQPPLIILPNPLIVAEKDTVVTVPIVENATWEVKYNAGAFTGTKTDTTFTPNAYGKYSIEYSKTVGDVTAKGTCVVMVENTANVHKIAVSNCVDPAIVGRDFPTVADDSTKMLFNSSTTKFSGVSKGAIGVNWTSDYTTATFTSVSFYIHNSSSKDIIMKQNNEHVMLTIKPDQWVETNITWGIYDYFKASAEPTCYIKDSVWNFRLLFQVPVGDYSINIIAVINP